jgi:hypothetical protein
VPARPHALSELAQRLKRMAREEAANSGTSVDRFRVIQEAPLVIEEIEGDLTLEEGDPDFTVGDALRQHIATYGIEKDDQILVAHAGKEWHAFDAASSSTPTGGPLESGSYTVSKVTTRRTLDPTTASTEDVANFVATLVRDLGGT